MFAIAPIILMEKYNNAIPAKTPLIPATKINVGCDNFTSCELD
jgi:hypothetical protein